LSLSLRKEGFQSYWAAVGTFSACKIFFRLNYIPPEQVLKSLAQQGTCNW